MKTEIIETAEILMIGDTFRLNLQGSKWLKAEGFRAYKNARFPHLECGGLAKVVDVTDSRGRSFAITVRPDDSLVYLSA